MPHDMELATAGLAPAEARLPLRSGILLGATRHIRAADRKPLIARWKKAHCARPVRAKAPVIT